jgi:stearoyl-CoA desaturase (delta-9 desaturase)
MQGTARLSAVVGPESTRHVVVDNDLLQAVQRRYALATIVLPFLGTVAAVASTAYRPIGAVDAGLLAVFYVLTSIGITVGFHRHFAHRTFQARPALRAALGVLGSMAAQGHVVYWVATHRRHHQFAEQDLDPHSPTRHEQTPLGRWRGFWHAHVGWMLHSRMTNTAKFASDLIRDPLVARVSEMYAVWVALGLVLPAAIGGVLTASWSGAIGGFLWGGVVRMFLVHHMMWTSGSTAHMFGTRPFATEDDSANNFLLALPNLGEGWHNNHHAFPYAAHFSLRWWQIDMGGWAIAAFEKLGLAWDIRGPSPDAVESRRKRAPAGGPPAPGVES